MAMAGPIASHNNSVVTVMLYKILHDYKNKESKVEPKTNKQTNKDKKEKKVKQQKAGKKASIKYKYRKKGLREQEIP